MKKLGFLLSMGMLMLASCQDFDYGEVPTPVDEEALYNAALKLGVKVDTEHDWSTVSSGSLTVTADAEMEDIVKVRILTESPFFNVDAYVLTEAEVTNGQTVTLTYDAPKTYTRLIAACVSSKGEYYIKGFNTTDSEVSFTNSPSTRAVGETRAAANMPNIDEIELKYSDSFLSFNARRALSDDATFSNWKGKNWENERMWLPSGPTSSNGWTIKSNTIYSDAPTLSDEDKATLVDIFNSSLYRDDKNSHNKKRDNLSLIREGKAVKFFNNHMVSTGLAGITLIPVQMASTEAHMCDIYYYYYKQENIPSGISEADYIKSLPKYKAVDLGLEREAFSEKTGIAKNNRDENFLRIHEYLLPYYGDPSDFESYPQTLSYLGYKTDAKFYRIHNASEGKNNYFTYADPSENLKDAYTEDVEKQLWQVFTNSSDPNNVKVMLYNVYAKQFLCYVGKEKNGVVLKDFDSKNLDKFCFRICDPNAKQTDSRTNIYIFENGMGNCLKSVSGVWIGNGGKNKGETRLWSFEEYTGSSATAITDCELPVQYFPNIHPAKSEKASAIIPAGYRIGFLIRKDNGQTDANWTLTNDKFGCLYGYGELNKEINSFGQFKSALTYYGMEEDDPRIAMFTANGKMYLCFEEGADTQYSDVIVELGGGVESFGDIPDLLNQVYTFCFEDREDGDYDMNDVVIKAVRTDYTHVTYSVEACGGTDKVYLRNLHGEKLNEETELHSLYSTTGIVNAGSSHVDPIKETFTVDPSFSFYDLDKVLYIYNATTGKEIRLSVMGEDPHAVMIPKDFDYPLEGICIKDAYPAFLKWVADRESNKDWYDNPEVEKCTYKHSAFTIEE
jgi:hypothetical protein